MEVVGRVIKKNPVPNLVADRDEFRRIFEDMRRSAGDFIPTPTWLLCQHPEDIEIEDTSLLIDAANSDEVFGREFALLEQRMIGWVGFHALSIADESVAPNVTNYAALLRDNDPLGLWRANVEDAEIASSMRVADLGSIMDLNFIYAGSFDPARKLTKILEVGGGYGRLAEAALNVFGKSIRYVMVDSVPVSLYYAKKYMERACPHVRVGSYYDGDEFDLDKFECYIIPSWYFEKLNRDEYDVCVNIESFQEMNQWHVDSYLRIFDAASREGAMMYISNAHDYIFRGDWRYPERWQKLLCAKTPRAQSHDHRTEVFVKSMGDFSAWNAAVEAVHAYHLSREDRAPARNGLTIGDQVEALAGKRARAAASYIKPLLERLVALKRKETGRVSPGE
jgi:hypothetical protein